MFFQISVTPTGKKPSRVRRENAEEQIDPQENFELVLAPFQPQTRIKLDTAVYNSVKCKLTIRNPSNRNLNVSVTKLPPPERCVVIDASELSVHAESSAQLEISWTPQESGSWRDNIQLTDSRKIKYDVAMVTTVHGEKKVVKGRSRVLGVANHNKSAGTRGTAAPAAREAKKNILTSYQGQSNAPSKRPRLNSIEPSNKENVSKNVWTSATTEETRVSQNPHDFSAIINSTKFNFTPLKERKAVPEIKITSSGATDFSPQETDGIPPAMQIVPDLRRETYNAREGRASSANQHSRDFSIVMNSTGFNFTPLKNVQTSGNADRTEMQQRGKAKIAFSPQDVGIVSPEIVDAPILRRETYVTAKNVAKPAALSFDERDEDEAEKDNFEDSLSPQPDARDNNAADQRKPSEFSIFINDVNFLTPKGPNSGQSVNFSPRGCSTGNRTKSIGGRETVDGESPFKNTGNDTFDISNSKNADNSRANGTYELPASPKASRNSDSVRPTRISRNFDRAPSLESIAIGDGMKNRPLSSFSSTPLGIQSSARTSTLPSSCKKNYDDASVKEVLEADLWVKSDEERCSSSMFSSSSKTSSCRNLNKINEESDASESLIFARTKTSEKTKKFTSFRRIDISPPKKYTLGFKSNPTRKVSPTKNARIRKDKHASEPIANFRKKVQMNCSIKRGRVTIPGVRITNLSLAGLDRSNLRDKEARNETKEISVKLHDPNDFLTRFCNPDPFGATMTQDPFLTSTLYYDEKWMYHQEMEFKKWLNALLTPPEHLDADVDTIRVDVGKVWQSCRTREDVALAESREAVSARYHTNTRLNTLRKAACAMFRREEITAPLSRVTVCVERGTLMIRQDRDMHRDIGLQKEILELFLSYNPLWLRIGLETIYGETIPLQSNNDLVGLTRFIISRFFSDPFIVKTHSLASTSSLKLPSFALSMNKFILKKFLMIALFLDYAKRNKLIGHDPCLFHKKATHKESRAILLTFSREVLSGVGDLTKVLRTHGYVVSHKQTYLDEYDYAMKQIATDLRDGVRLCRVMELITGDRNLTSRCRVPAISRLQKVHNVDLALGALLRCGYSLTGDIDAKSIADGHREKTLSLLWQIIYKYQAPRWEKAAMTLQRWWRSKLWYIRIRNYLRDRRDNAASTIQRAWKCRRARKIVDELREERKRLLAEKDAAIRVVQLRWIRRKRMLDDRKNFLDKRKAAICLQRWFRRRRETKPFVGGFLTKLRAIKVIQNHWRARVIGKKERTDYLILLDSARKIQTWWRARRAGRRILQDYESLRRATIVVQTRWRASRSMKIARRSFEERRNAARIVQSWWRRCLRLKRDRNDYLLKKNAVRIIENWLIGRKIANIERKRFGAKRQAILLIQRNFRRYLETRDGVIDLRRSKQACRVIQRWLRTVIIAKRYKTMKNSSIVVQRWWRGALSTRTAVKSFADLRRAATIVQKNWRMKAARGRYLRVKKAVSAIELWYKSVLSVRTARRDFTTKRNAVLKLQRWWRSLRIGRERRFEFLEYRRTIIAVQTKWRAKVLARETRMHYLRMTRAIVVIQSTRRMIKARRAYLDLARRHAAAKILQRRWRETLRARRERESYVEYRRACVTIQKRYRELRASRETRQSYSKLRRAAVVVQKNWRMLRVSRLYEKQKNAAVVLQTRWRARKKCQVAHRDFTNLRRATINMQRRYRSKKEGQDARRKYLELRSSVIKIQTRWRANRSMKEARELYGEYRRAAILVQSRWRAIAQLREYRRIREAISTIQTKWRAVKLAREARRNYETLRRSVVLVQRRYRANKLRDVVRADYRRTIMIITRMQRSWREKLEARMRDEAAINVQTWWKSIIAMRECKKRYQDERSAALVLQRRYRAWKIASRIRCDFLRVVRSVVTIQRSWRRHRREKLRENWLKTRKLAIVTIEKWWTLVLRRKREREKVLAKLKKKHDAATSIQSVWRGYVVRSSQCSVMKEVRKRSERAAEAAVPTATVAFVLRESMDLLLACDTIGQLSLCLTNIDTLTRLSLNGCKSFCELNLVDKIYRTLAKSNRSVPWLDVCVRCTSILITLAKLEETKKYIYRIEYIEILARLMSISIDHHLSLFLHLATLLWLLSENPDYAKAVTGCPRSTWLLGNLHTTISKKRSKLPVGSLNKTRGKEKMVPLPNTKPDWGIKTKRPRLFTTEHHAITSLIKRLKIDSPA